jgi:hypothetical protein
MTGSIYAYSMYIHSIWNILKQNTEFLHEMCEIPARIQIETVDSSVYDYVVAYVKTTMNKKNLNFLLV